MTVAKVVPFAGQRVIAIPRRQRRVRDKHRQRRSEIVIERL